MELREKRLLNFFCDDCQEGSKLLHEIPDLIAKIDDLQEEIMITKENTINEIHERQRRANNSIMFNVPEASRQKTDFDTVKEIVSEIFQDLSIVKTIRVGKKNKNGNRLLKVALRNSDDALSIAKNKKKMKKESFLEVDLTIVQIYNTKQLRE
ncbi:unnamed protein product [Psylliodes chrysocephalus]|uniref:Uncharacterized protein n=1 Tax=Psylliodes chrysocephalus TaxID=3402493 RepID=A0A9P0CZ59_9CUCU|nr:unnamed protein product [Psylliodes chrysocephala]